MTHQSGTRRLRSHSPHIGQTRLPSQYRKALSTRFARTAGTSDGKLRLTCAPSRTGTERTPVRRACTSPQAPEALGLRTTIKTGSGRHTAGLRCISWLANLIGVTAAATRRRTTSIGSARGQCRQYRYEDNARPSSHSGRGSSRERTAAQAVGTTDTNAYIDAFSDRASQSNSLLHEPLFTNPTVPPTTVAWPLTPYNLATPFLELRPDLVRRLLPWPEPTAFRM
jgi:hypothetical protein